MFGQLIPHGFDCGEETLSNALGANVSHKVRNHFVPSALGNLRVDSLVSDDLHVARAIGDCWVEVRDGSGALILARLLRVGESYQVPKERNLTLLAGNAGGLQIDVDGRKLAPLGAEGTVLRNVALNPESLLKSFGSVQ